MNPEMDGFCEKLKNKCAKKKHVIITVHSYNALLSSMK